MRPFRWYDHFSLNLFWLGLNIRNTAVGSVFLPYLVDVFVRSEVKNTALGSLRTAGLLIAMVVQPAAGLLSDRSTSRFGRRRPFILVGVIFDLIFLGLIAISGSYWWLFATTMLLQVSANVSHGPLQGLIPDMVPEAQRGRSSAVKAILELLPIVLVAIIIANLVSAGKFNLAVIATGVGLLLTMLLTLALVKEKPLTEKPLTSLREPMLRVLGVLAGILVGALAGLISGGIFGGVVGLIARFFLKTPQAIAIGVSAGGLVAMVVAVVAGVWSGARATLGNGARQHASFTWWIVNRLFFLAAVTSIQGFVTFFLMDAFQVSREEGVKMTADLTMVVGIFTLLSAFPSGWLSDRVGRKALVSISGALSVLGTLVLLVTTVTPNLPLIYFAGILIGLGAGLFMTTNWAMGTDLAPPSESGHYLGISNLAGAGAGMIGAGIGGPIADIVNRSYPGMGYFVLFACYTVLFALSSFTLLRIKDNPS